MRFLRLVHKFAAFHRASSRLYVKRVLSTHTVEPELKDLMSYLDSLTNYEKLGVPKDAGTDSEDGFDLVRMRKLMEHLDNPHSKFKAVHVAGTKGKGSTAAFISNILRAEGYSVGCYTSPHIMTIRERMSVGKSGDPVSVKKLNCVFHMIKHKLDEAIKMENGSLTHFEVLTGLAFALFAEENVHVAVIEAGLGGARDATNVLSSSGLAASVITTIGEEHLAALGGSLESIAIAKAGIIKQGRPLVLGGPFLPHIEHILRDKASSMCSPVLSASGPGNSATIKGMSMLNGEPCQLCDIIIEVEKQCLKLSDVKLRMLGSHQLKNAATAACAALCLRDEGWNISDGSIQAGLESTRLPGRSQFLSSKETEALGIPGATVLLDGAHTKESAKALMDTIRMIFPAARLALVVAMATDKDHLAFARELLSGGQLEAVLLTETDIAGGKSRTTSDTLLRDSWIQACEELGINALHDGMPEFHKNQLSSGRVVLAAEKSLEASMKIATQILKTRGCQPNVVVVTGSLHIVSSVLASLPK